jgi:hypothetical protein
MKHHLSEILHPCGPFYALIGTLTCGCWNCGRSFETRGLTAHRESTTGRVHVHCTHCGSIRLVTRYDRLRLWVRRSLSYCADTPARRTEAWFIWHPDWHVVQWSSHQDGFVNHRLWFGPGDQFYTLTPTGDGDRVHLQPASVAEVNAYRASEALCRAIYALAAGHVPSKAARDLAREAGIDIHYGGED